MEEHRKNARPSTWDKHSLAEARRQADKEGEKGDTKRKRQQRKRSRPEDKPPTKGG